MNDNQTQNLNNDFDQVNPNLSNNFDSNSQIDTQNIENEFEVSNLETQNQVTSLQSEVEQLKNELALVRTQKLQALADCDNLRKRFEIDLANAKNRGNSTILSKLLEFAEDFERMIQNSENESDVEKLKNNISLISGKLAQFLKNQDIIELDVKVGDEFNEETMEAVGIVQVEQNKDSLVQIVVQKGYKVQSSGIILRPAKVIVGKSELSN